MAEPSAKGRTTSSKKYLTTNPGDVDDDTAAALKGFKQAKGTREDPAYRKILAKCSPVKNQSRWGGNLVGPKQDKTHDAPIECSRGKATEK